MGSEGLEELDYADARENIKLLLNDYQEIITSREEGEEGTQEREGEEVKKEEEEEEEDPTISKTGQMFNLGKRLAMLNQYQSEMNQDKGSH